jgi:hypothetical protein
MKVSEEMMYIRCMAIESMIKTMVLNGNIDNGKLVEAVNNVFPPTTPDEMERYSEAIIYAKYSILN